MGRLRAESLNLVDAELAVRITPDGYVTVSAGDNARPLATGVASKRRGGMPRHLSGSTGSGAAHRCFPPHQPLNPARCPLPMARKAAAGRPRLARQPEPDRT